MTKLWIFLTFILALSQTVGAQSDIRQKLLQAQQLLKSIDAGKIAPENVKYAEEELDRLLRDGRKVLLIANPPFTPKHWLCVYRNGAWEANVHRTFCKLRYIPSYSLLKSGYWQGGKVSLSQFKTFCREQGLDIARFTNSVVPGPVKNVSREGKKLFCQWVADYALDKFETDVIIDGQSGEGFDLIIPKREGVYYQIARSSLPDASGRWKDWAQEKGEVAGALLYWQNCLTYANPDEQTAINKWISALKKRQGLLVHEKSLYGEIEAARKKLADSRKDATQDMLLLDKALSLTKGYLNKCQRGQISRHYEKNVEFQSDQWRAMRADLQNMEKLAMQIQAKMDVLQKRQGSTPEQLRDLQNLAKLIENYQDFALEAYKNPRVGDWQKDVSNRLADTVFKTELTSLRKEYDGWIAHQNEIGIDSELESLDSFFQAYRQYLENVKKIKQLNPYQRKVEQWFETAKKHSAALAAEKKIFAEISELYAKWKALSAGDPKTMLAMSEKGIAACDTYQKQLRERKISSYHQEEVTGYSKEMSGAKILLEREMEMVATLEKLNGEYNSASFSMLADEKASLAKLLAQAKSYEQKLQLREIKGFHRQQVKEIAIKSQTRQDLLVNEENLYAQIQMGWKKWQSKHWENLKSEQNILAKVLDNCRNYLARLKVGEISAYNRDQVEQWRMDLETRKQKLDKEEKFFEKLRRLQSDHLKKGSYPDLQSEKNVLSALLGEFQKYLGQLKHNEISSYYRQQVQSWYNENSAQKNRLVAEEKLQAKIAKMYEKWQTSGWKSGKEEAKTIDRTLAACRDYQKKLPLRKISGYYREEVSRYFDLLKKRGDQITAEKKLFAEIESTLRLSGKQFKHLEEEQLELESLISKCREYGKYLDAGKISDYHKAQIAAWSGKTEEKLHKLQEVVDSVKQLKSSFENWQIVPRWPNLEKEEEALAKILSKTMDYRVIIEKSATKDYYRDKVEIWTAQVQARQKQLRAEKELYGKIKKIERKVNDGQFNTLVDEKKNIQKLDKLAEEHKKKSRAKLMSNHYQRSIRQMKKKLKARLGKLEKEDRKFKQVNKAYKRWKETTWGSPADEKRAINSVLDKINDYNEHVQMKKISTYYQKQVSDYKKEVEKRKKKIN